VTGIPGTFALALKENTGVGLVETALSVVDDVAKKLNPEAGVEEVAADPPKKVERGRSRVWCVQCKLKHLWLIGISTGCFWF